MSFSQRKSRLYCLKSNVTLNIYQSCKDSFSVHCTVQFVVLCLISKFPSDWKTFPVDTLLGEKKVSVEKVGQIKINNAAS